MLVAQEDFVVDAATSRTIPNYLGKVKLKKGEVFRVDDDGKRQALEGGGKVLKGDIVETGSLSYVSIEIIDDSLISLGPNSRFQFEQFEFKEKKDRKAVYRFVQGQMRAHIPYKAKPGDIEFRSKTTTMGIEGTIFLANSFTNPEGTDVFECAVLEGKVATKSQGVPETQSVSLGQHLVYMKKGDSIDHGMKTLPEEVSLEMLHRDDNPAKEMLPLLDLYASTSINESRGRQPASVDSPTVDTSARPPARKENPGHNWRDSLKGLNNVWDDYNASDDGLPNRN